MTFEKGHDVLVDALRTLLDVPWQCACVGSLDRDPAFVQGVRRHTLDGRVSFAGVRTGAELDRLYATADLLVDVLLMPHLMPST